jgi:hypothetical protein
VSWLPVKLFGKPIRMLFRYGWLMSNLDYIIHTTGAVLLIGLGFLLVGHKNTMLQTNYSDHK